MSKERIESGDLRDYSANYPGGGRALKVVATLTNEEGITISSENPLRTVGSTAYIELTLTLDTSGAYASGDVLFDTQELTGILREAGATGIIYSLTVLDKDDQAQAMDILLLRTNVSIGTENAAVSISDANADEILGFIRITSSDYVDLVNSHVATKTSLGLGVKGNGTANLYIAGITRGTPTHTANGITIKIVMLQD